MANNKPYETQQMGFDRTQLFKEYTQPQITRSSALNATMDWCKINQYPLSLSEVIALSQHFVAYIEEGKTDWMKKTENYLKEKHQDNDSILID
jgi:hypothetical protein